MPSTKALVALVSASLVSFSDTRRLAAEIVDDLTSSTNCLSTSGFCSVCSGEREGVMQHLEKDIAAPSAVPFQIMESVSALHSDTAVDAPRNLSASLLGHLKQIAEVHSCPFPLEATMEEMQAYHARMEQEAVHEEEVEELVAGHHEMHSVPRGSSTTSLLRGIMALAALVSFAVPLLRAAKVAAFGDQQG